MKELEMTRCGPTEEDILAVHAIVQDAMTRNAAIFGDMRMEKDDDDDSTDDSSDDDASGGDDDSDDPGTEGQGGKTSDDDTSGGESEEAKLRKRMRAADQRASTAERELRELKDKDKPELERAQNRVKELEPQIEALGSTVRDLRLQVAFLSANEFTWHDPEDALRLADMDGVEIDDDGKVIGLKDALKKLATSKPHLVKKEQSSDDDEDEGKPSGSTQNGKRKGDKKALDREALAKKYPALRR